MSNPLGWLTRPQASRREAFSLVFNVYAFAKPLRGRRAAVRAALHAYRLARTGAVDAAGWSRALRDSPPPPPPVVQ